MNKYRLKRSYYTITYLAEILKVNTSKIRFWESYFGICVNRRGKRKGNKAPRTYSRNNAISFVRINRLSKSGKYTLFGIRCKLGI